MDPNQNVLYDILDELKAMKEEMAKLRSENQFIKEQLNKHLNQNADLPRLQNSIVSQIPNKIVAITLAKDLPKKILLEIFKFLPHEDRKQVRLVCKHFQQILDSITKTTLQIDYRNLREIRARIEKKNIGGLNFKRVRLRKLNSDVDIKFILQSIGKQIDHLSIYKTEVWENFSRLVPNIKSLELTFRPGSRSYESHLNQCEFPLLEKLVLNNWFFPLETNLLLTKISKQNSTIVLKELDLECVSLCEDSVKNVLRRHANSLEILYIRFREPCRSECVPTLSEMFKLKKIYLYGDFGHEFLRTIFNAIPKLSALEVIDICRFKDYDLSDPITWDLRELKKLRELRLCNCPLPNAQLIGKRPLMEILQVTAGKINQMDLIRLISCFPNLRTLELRIAATAMTNTTLSNIFRHQTRMQRLTIDECNNITDAGLIGTKDDPYSISSLTYLEELQLNQLGNLTDQTLGEAFHFPRLRSLYLGESNKITSKGIKKLGTNCPRLKELTISSDTADNGNALFIIRHGLKQLNRLVLRNCHGKDYHNVFNSLKDPLTNEPFASKCDFFCYK